MLLTKAIVQGSSSALKMAKSLIENPMIISLTAPQFGMSLEVETYAKIGNADVSQYPIITPGTNTKQFLNDNVAPHPLEWNLSGFIAGDDFVEKTCNFTPVVMVNTLFLWIAFNRGARIVFKDMDQQVYINCVIANLQTGNKKDCKNKMPFTMTIKQIKEIDASAADLTETEQSANPDGEDANMGATQTETVQGDNLTTLARARTGIGNALNIPTPGL